jgi:hypothetical protein
VKEIPMPYIKANQTGIVLFVIAAIVLQLPWLLAVLFVVQAVGYLFGLKYNAFVALAKPFIRTEGSETQAAVLTRFNNSLALLFLTGFLICWAFGWLTAGYVFALMLAVAATAAILGYCVGCTIYFQYKQMRARMR